MTGRRRLVLWNVQILLILIVGFFQVDVAYHISKKSPVSTAQNSNLKLHLMKHHQKVDDMVIVANSLASKGKGVLAADESTKTIGKRFQTIGVDNNEDNRRAYRDLLFSTPMLNKFISGAILSEETLFQCNHDGILFPQILKKNNIIPGIKVDKGLAPLSGGETEETWSVGLEGLKERAETYYAQGAKFAKWRSVVTISDRLPSRLALEVNAQNLGLYARIVQEAGLVPIIEPEILMTGAHTIDRNAEVQTLFLSMVYDALRENDVILEASLLKPSMVCPGIDSATPSTSDEIAEYTLQVLQQTVPSTVPGILFLSGGLSEEDASKNLNAINVLHSRHIANNTMKGDSTDNGRWRLSFSFGRALQTSCLHAWQGCRENREVAQAALLARARANSLASLGCYQSTA